VDTTKRKLTLAFGQQRKDEAPEIVSSYDDVIEDAWGGVPDYYIEERGRFDGETRELVIVIPEHAVQDLFATPEIEGTVQT